MAQAKKENDGIFDPQELLAFLRQDELDYPLEQRIGRGGVTRYFWY